MPSSRRPSLVRVIAVVALALALALGACAVAPPRTDDPLQGFNRKMYAFNKTADKIAIRPVAKAYVKITGPTERILIGNFFENLRTPITVVNELLQGRPGPALQSTGRFLINTTVGFLGIFDPASEMKLPAHTTDFGVTLAHWGVPEGPFLVLPFVGPTTLRDVWRLPVDGYFSPLFWYRRANDLSWRVTYLPSAAYLITLRAKALPFDDILQSSYDPYAFTRDAYRQRRLNEIYYGDPPLSAIEQLQGTASDEMDDDEISRLLEQQRHYENTREPASGATPSPAASTAGPAAPTSVATPAPAGSVPVPAGSAPAPAASSG